MTSVTEDGDDHDDGYFESEEVSSFPNQEMKKMTEKEMKRSSFQVDQNWHLS